MKGIFSTVLIHTPVIITDFGVFYPLLMITNITYIHYEPEPPKWDGVLVLRVVMGLRVELHHLALMVTYVSLLPV